MSQPRSERIQRVARLAAFDAEATVRVVRDAAGALDAAARRLGELQRFRGDYASAPREGTLPPVRGIELANRSHFVEQIDHAIAQKSIDVDACTERWQKARTTWIRQRQRSRMLATVAARCRQAERVDADRVDQAEVEDQWRSNARARTTRNLSGDTNHEQ